MRKMFLAAFCAFFLVLLTQTSAQAFTVEGEARSLGDGTARTYITIDNDGDVTDVGVILSDDALSNLPADAEEYLLPLPLQANTTAITEIGLNWQAHGHLPPGIYSAPHFDVHAYVIPPAARDFITATGADLDAVYATPAPELVPARYVMAPDSAEAAQGSHWIDPTAEEFQGDPHGFNHTFIYGFYNGEMTFVEPMVSLDFLHSGQAFESAIALPQHYSKPGWYPTGYSITHDEATGEHIISLTGFTPSTPETP